jgi:hypothetical protein
MPYIYPFFFLRDVRHIYLVGRLYICLTYILETYLKDICIYIYSLTYILDIYKPYIYP